MLLLFVFLCVLCAFVVISTKPMNFRRLLLENLLYHWRGNLAVLLGVAVGTAVLTGALLVGDSLRGSLRHVAEEQLGWVDLALVNKRFFREELAEKLSAKHLSPAILLQVSAAREQNGKPVAPRIRQVVLLGVDGRFWSGSPSTEGKRIGGMTAPFWNSPEDSAARLEEEGVVLGAALAQDLGVQAGDRLVLSLQKFSAVPRETLLGRRETQDVVAHVSLPVRAVLPDDHFGSRFTLNPGPSLPRNAFVPLRLLQQQLPRLQSQKGSEAGRNRSLPEGPINAVLAAGADREALQAEVKKYMQLDDWGLVLRQPRRRFGIPAPKYLSLESRELFVQPPAQAAVQQAGLRSGPTLVYLVNGLTVRPRLAEAAAAVLVPPAGPGIAQVTLPTYALTQAAYPSVAYPIVAALDPTQAPPLGPFLPARLAKLADDEILLVDWQGSPLKGLRPGARLTMTYYNPGDEGYLREESADFRLAAHVPLSGARNDLYLTPEFPGVTDSPSIAGPDGWDPPFPFRRWLVTKVDEQYWNEHRTTPRAYITLKAGQRLWGSRFGDLTSIRIDPQGQSKESITRKILDHLDPAQGGLIFQDVRGSKLQAAASGTDFGGYFAGFSSFLIIAALLLVGLMFRLNLDRRASEIGLLLAVGHQRRTVHLLLLAEGTLLAMLGGLVGLAAALGYAQLLLDFLAASWPGGLNRSFLQLYVAPLSLLYGFGGAVAFSILTILWSTWMLAGVPPRALLEGETTTGDGLAQARRLIWSKVVLGVGLAGGGLCMAAGAFFQDHEIKATCFLCGGLLLLTAGLAAVWLWLRRRHPSAHTITHGGATGLARLGARNAGRHPLRSLLTVGLLALATFLIVAVQAFHRDPGRQFLERTGGSGGFPLLAECDLPVFQDPNTPGAQPRQGQLNHGGMGVADPVEQHHVTFYPFRVKEGDDVSCLNLYRPREPRLFGVPDAIIQRGGFQFANTEATTPEERDNPWLLLQKPRDDGAIPVFGENNTVTYVLGSGLGGEINVTDGYGRPVRLRIVGLLQDSVFQSELLMADANFRRLYPQIEGFQFFLIDTPPTKAGDVRVIVENDLADYGMAVTPTPQRLEAYLAVENTYLATFQALGGLGLLLGALGLAVVLLRSVWERRGELALLRALGFRRSALSWLVLAENALLLILGLLVGTGAALLSVAPHLASGADVPWLQLAGLLVLVMSAGLLAGLLAVRATLRAPLLAALRKE
jgi:ABC-type lipoprotein release transport system permease subunit